MGNTTSDVKTKGCARGRNTGGRPVTPPGPSGSRTTAPGPTSRNGVQKDVVPPTSSIALNAAAPPPVPVKAQVPRPPAGTMPGSKENVHATNQIDDVPA